MVASFSVVIWTITVLCARGINKMNEDNNKSGVDSSRRGFIKKLAYIPPVVMTLSATPSYATIGSGRNCKDGEHQYSDNNYSGGSNYSGNWSFHK